MFKHLGRLVLILALVVVGFVAGRSVQAQGAQPGSDQDPLVSQSYVDKVIAETKAYVDTKLKLPVVPVAAPQLEVVTVNAGQKITLSGGSEAVLRQGKATVIASSSGGISDLTLGRDLTMGEQVVANHLLLVPKTDGRGLQAIDSVILLVRGAYVLGN